MKWIALLFVLAGLCFAQDPPASQYSATILVRNLKDPTNIAFRPDGKIYITLKAGTVMLYDPVTKTSTTAATLPAANVREDGLWSLILDPNFTVNHWVYVYFSERSTADTNNVVARYEVDANTGAFITTSRATLLKVPYTLNNSTAEHNDGALAFGPGGNLFIGLPDNTQNIFSGNGAGYSPRDPSRPLYDAQRSAANTNDLRGKLLRIHPETNGTYTIPSGNLWEFIDKTSFNPNWNSGVDDIAKVRKEIYTFGSRHPFRVTVDSVTGWVYWAEPGPNATADNSVTGPRGYEEVNLAKSPGYYGWPYCVGNNFCYTQYNYSNNTGGATYVPTTLQNTSVNNTGIRDLPPAKPAVVWYPYNSTGTAFPVFGNSTVNTGSLGPIYNYNPAAAADRLPAVFDRHLFIVEWVRNVILVAYIDSAGALQNLRTFRSLRDTVTNGPIDIKVGRDGALYFLNWVNSTSGNTAYSYPTNSGTGTLVRFAYTGPQTAVSSQFHAAHLPVSRFEVLGTGASLIVPIGAKGLDCYDLKGVHVWSYRRSDVSRSENLIPPAGLVGVLRVLLYFPESRK